MGDKHLGRRAAAAAARGGLLTFEGVTHTSAELFERSRRLAGGLLAVGLRPGDRVVIMMANCPEVGMAYNACGWGGLVATPLIFLASVPELAHVIGDSGARAIITTPEFVEKVAQAVAEMGTAAEAEVPTFVVGEPSFQKLEAAPAADLVERDGDDLAALLYTGGTTGRSKGVMLSHANLYGTGLNAATSRAAAGDDLARSITALPLAHAYGLLVTVTGLFVDDQPFAVLQQWFHGPAFLDLIEQHRIEVASVVPSMLQMLLALPPDTRPLEARDLSSLLVVTSGGAPLSPAVLAEWERRVPSCTVLEGYGLTESSALVSASTRRARRVGAVGKPVANVDVKILDGDGREPPPGEDGEICVRGATVMAGYWNAPEQTAQTVTDGWLHTGDVGHLDDDGFLFVVDRMKDLIIRGGFNVYPRDVEDVLLAHPDVTHAAAVGQADAVHGEEVVAAVTVKPGSSVTGEELVAYARERIGRTKYPRIVRIVDAVPLTSVGKTDRKAVRELFVTRPARSPHKPPQEPASD
jgi:long-chain acyl-CoA synthetase